MLNLYSVIFEAYASNPAAWVGVCRNMLQASLLGSWEYLQKKKKKKKKRKAERMPGVEALRPGYYIIN